ncbi:hypothetical protein [Streptomyces sp. NPDC058155]|uniref:hypothetical protein n=1 Tax=Streptomyces sp. NPDC058155 TaxID=3346359 RepID=UPI0036ED2F3B
MVDAESYLPVTRGQSGTAGVLRSGLWAWLGLGGVVGGLVGLGQEPVFDGGALGGGVAADDLGAAFHHGEEALRQAFLNRFLPEHVKARRQGANAKP